MNRPIRLNDEQRKAIEASLAQGESSFSAATKRTDFRYAFRESSLRVRITQPGGGCSEGLVPPRNLSGGGISFIYWNFLYNGTTVEVELQRLTGQRETILGKVSWCRHIGGTFHAVGVKFDERILPQLYVDRTVAKSPAKPAPAASETPKRVLFLDDQEIDRMLFTYQMTGTAIEPFVAGTVKQAMDILRNTSIDVILCDLCLTEMTGEEAIKCFRDAKFIRPIIVLTSETSPARLRAAEVAGAKMVVQKPYEPAALRAILLEHSLPDMQSHQAVHSSLASAPGNEAILSRYIEMVRSLAEDIQKAAARNDLPNLRTCCQTIKGSGSGYGFALLSECARAVLVTMDVTQSISQLQPSLSRLQDVCRRLSADKP